MMRTAYTSLKKPIKDRIIICESYMEDDEKIIEKKKIKNELKRRKLANDWEIIILSVYMKENRKEYKNKTEKSVLAQTNTNR